MFLITFNSYNIRMMRFSRLESILQSFNQPFISTIPIYHLKDEWITFTFFHINFKLTVYRQGCGFCLIVLLSKP